MIGWAIGEILQMFLMAQTHFLREYQFGHLCEI